VNAKVIRSFAAIILSALPGIGATLGRPVPIIGGATDLALDEARSRIYLTSSVQNLIQVYSIQSQSVQTTVQTDQTPLSVAISRNGKFLYVTCFDSSALDVIDLDTLAVTIHVGLPARPEGVAVGRDGRVLISTAGSGTNSASNVLLLYDPAPNAAPVLTSISVAPIAPAAPVFPSPSGRPFLSTRSQLAASRDGATIVGVNQPLAGPSTAFVYETASTSVLRSRIIAGSSTSLSVSDDGSRFMSGSNLFETATLQLLAQVNAANVPYPVAPTTVYTVQTNQGGSAFSPDGQTLYAAFNVPPVQAATNLSQLMLADPDNLMVRMGIQLPENLAGKIVVSADGNNAYALSDSGFVILPLGTIARSPLAVPSSRAALLIKDPCAVNGQSSTAAVTINNPGQGRVTANAQLLQYAGVAGQSSPVTAPTVRANQATAGPQIVFTFNNAAARGTGSIAPPHDFLIQSPEAINIPDRVRVYENSRDSDARGILTPIPTGSTAASGLTDLIFDQPRQRLYIANAGLNQVEVFDIRQQKLLAPVKVGQLPVSMALTPDGNTLYVANAGSEAISIVDPDKLQVTGRVTFPPIPFNSNLAPVLPSVISAGLSGLQILTSDGVLWKANGNTAVPRGVSRIIGQTAQGLPARIPLPSYMAAAPGGEYIVLYAATGFVYLFDATLDDFVAGRQVFTAATQTGYIGPITVGPRGQFLVVNGTALNQALASTGARLPTGLVSAVAAVGNTSYAIFSPPPAPAANAAPTAAPTVQIIDANTGNASLQVPALESPLVQAPAGAARTIINGRLLAVDSAGGNAYAITTSGLSIIPLSTVTAASRPLPNQRGAVNLASYQTQVAPNALLSIFGQNLGASEVASSTPWPLVLGGTCVTLNNIALPLIMTSPTQINAQIPPELAVGTYPLVVRSVERQAASAPQQLTVSKYAPAVFTDGVGKTLLFHADGRRVDHDSPATRDEHLLMYAAGLGPTTGGPVTSGAPSPADPPAVVKGLQVFFGDPRWEQAEIIVDWSGLAPGMVGVYQLNLRIPGFHINGDALPVTLRIGNVNSPTTGPVVPYVSVD